MLSLGLFVWKTGLFLHLSEFWKCNLKAMMKANKLYLMILASVYKWTIVSQVSNCWMFQLQHTKIYQQINSEPLGNKFLSYFN